MRQDLEKSRAAHPELSTIEEIMARKHWGELSRTQQDALVRSVAQLHEEGGVNGQSDLGQFAEKLEGWILAEAFQRLKKDGVFDFWGRKLGLDRGDLEQSSFLMSLEREVLAGYDPARAALLTYLTTIVVRHAKNMLRDKRLKKRQAISLNDLHDFPEIDVLALSDSASDKEAVEHERLEVIRQSLARVEGLIDKLSWETIQLVVQHPSLKKPELAKLIGVSEFTFKSRLFTARKRLREIIMSRTDFAPLRQVLDLEEDSE